MRKQFVLVLILFIGGTCFAQVSFDEYRKQQRAEYKQYKSEQQKAFDEFRKKVNDEYADFMKHAWEKMEPQPAVEPVKEKVIPPVVYKEPEPEQQSQQQTKPQQDQQTKPQPEQQQESKALSDNVKKQLDNKLEAKQEQETPKKVDPLEKIESKTAPIESKPIAVQPVVIVLPKPTPAPEPIVPAVEPSEDPASTTTVKYYGTVVKIKFPEPDKFKLKSLSEDALSDAWKELSGDAYNVTLKDALDTRKKLQLCDWAYVDLLQQVTEKQYGKSNEAVFMQDYLLTQSGYRVRLGASEKDLYLLIASQYDLFNRSYFTIDGIKFYAVAGKVKGLKVCKAPFENEKTLSMQIAQPQKLTNVATDERTLVSKRGVTAKSKVNKNDINFFDTYPEACIGGDGTTKWAVYANTPLSPEIKQSLYPQLKETTDKLGEKDAVGALLNWVQTAFKYEYDDKVWGRDRVFFAEETLYYPSCDCEDRSILFSRLVRDILGLDVVLLYYPGHLATAVHFNKPVKGDYLTYKGKDYVVCDPTYINAGVGRTMPGMDNQKAKVIALQ